MRRAEIEDSTILLSMVGSQAYGLATPESDKDYKGCFVAHPRYYFGFNTIEQKDQGWDEKNDPASKFHFLNGTDTSIYEVSKFVSLVLNNNPSILEILFMRDEFHIYKDPCIQQLLDNRHLFLSKKCRHSLAGYGYSQLNKIKSHRKWLLDPPKSPPNMEDYGLGKAFKPLTKSETNAFLEFLYILIRDTLNHIQDVDDLRDLLIEKVDIKGVLKQKGIPEEVIPYAGALTRSSKDFTHLLHMTHLYKKDLDHWHSYLSWKKNRNSKRAELERKIGYDAKFGSHALRLLSMGIEALRDKTIIVDRREAGDADYLLSVKHGNIPYKELMQKANELLALLDPDSPNGLYKTSTLRNKPDRKSAEDLCINIVKEKLGVHI